MAANVVKQYLKESKDIEKAKMYWQEYN